MVDASALLKRRRNMMTPAGTPTKSQQSAGLVQVLSAWHDPFWPSRVTHRVAARMSDTAIQVQRNARAARRDDGVIFLAFPYAGDDTQLVRELQARQPAASGHFYARFAQPVRGLIFRILGRDNDLEDTVQEVFVRAIESIGRLRDASALRAW